MPDLGKMWLTAWVCGSTLSVQSHHPFVHVASDQTRTVGTVDLYCLSDSMKSVPSHRSDTVIHVMSNEARTILELAAWDCGSVPLN